MITCDTMQVACEGTSGGVKLGEVGGAGRGGAGRGGAGRGGAAMDGGCRLLTSRTGPACLAPLAQEV
jgi:hypothetical protein